MLKKPTLIFREFARKYKWLGNFDKVLKEFIRKIEFFTIFGKVDAKNRAFGNNIIFLQQFFSISGGLYPFSPIPWRRLCYTRINRRGRHNVCTLWHYAICIMLYAQMKEKKTLTEMEICNRPLIYLCILSYFLTFFQNIPLLFYLSSCNR